MTTSLWSQSRLPATPSIDQNKRLGDVGLNSALLPDIPDPTALHTKKGTLFEQPAMNGDDIAIMYYQLTGKRVLPTTQGAQVEIKIVQPGPLTNQEVADLIETKLMMEGFALAESPGNPRQLRLLPAAGGTSNARNTGVRIITDKNKLPTNDEIVTYAMPMTYMKPEEAAQVFQSVIGQLGPGGTVVPVADASKILITDNALLIRSIIDLKNQIDVPGSINLDTKFVELIFADAEEVAGQLNELINDDEVNNSNAIQRQNNVPNNLANTGGRTLPNIIGAVEDVPLRIVAENRTNRVILSGSRQKIALAETLIRQFDQPSSDKNSLRRKLKYLPVTEFMPIAANAIEATLGNNSGGGGTNSNRPNNNQPSSNNQAGNNTGSGTSRSASIGGEDGTTAPDSQLIGKTLLVADNISNSVVVHGPPHHIEIVNNLINELDTRSEQVAITAIFGRYGNTDNSTFGSEIAALFGNDNTTPNFGGGSSNISGVYDSTDISTFAQNAINAGLGLGFANTDFGVFLNATKSIGSFEEFSRPTVFTTNNRSARISSGRRIAVPTGSVSGTTGVASTQIDFRDVALDLEVRPLVNGDDEITVEISLVNDTLGDVRLIDGIEINDILSEELSTIITISDKSLIVLGGLYTEREEQSSNKVPILGDIPLLGRLFSSEAKGTNVSELVIMIYARIASDTRELSAYQDEYDSRSFISRDSRQDFHNNSLLDKLDGDLPHKKSKHSSSTKSAYHHDRVGIPRYKR